MKSYRHRSSSVKQSTLVRFSDRGYAYADLGLSKSTGIIPFYKESERPNLKDIPPGVPIFNTDTFCLEISDPCNNTWISICQGALSGNELSLGIPTDGTYLDGAITLDPEGTLADAIDLINEYLVTCCSSGSVQYGSNLGTTNGTTNGILIDPIFTLGRVSSPIAPGNPYYTNSWDNDVNRDLTIQPTLTWELDTGERITDLQGGTISGLFYNGNSDIVHTEVLNLDGTTLDQNSTPSGYISVSNLINLGTRKEGFLSVSIPTSALLNGDSGYIRVSLSHTTETNDLYTADPLEFFKDSKIGPDILDQSIVYSGGPEKYLSGIKFATISGISYPAFLITVSGEDTWEDSYRSDPLLVNGLQFGFGNYVVNYNSSNVTKNSNTPPVSPYVYNEDFIYSEVRNITNNQILNPDQNGNYKTISFTIRDPFYSNTGSSIEPNPRVLINTLPGASTDNREYFTDEEYRLLVSSSGTGYMSDISGSGRGIDAWDSTLDLTTDPALQVINGRLIYPKHDYSSTAPVVNPDYSVMASGVGDLVYIRRFRDPAGLSHSNGVFRIAGLSEIDRSSGNILIDIRVVGDHIVGNNVQGIGNEGTGWLSLNTDYNFATFAGDDGDGCFVTTGGYSAPDFEFTLGGFATAYAHNEAIEVRVTFKDPQALNKYINNMEITDWD